MRKKIIKNLVKTATLLFMSLLFFNCEKEADLELNDIQTLNNNTEDVIISKLKKAGFYTDDGLRKFEEGYIVENDIYLTIDQINEMANKSTGSKGNAKKQYIANNIVSGTRTIRVFMDTSFGSYMQNAFDDALNRYNRLDLKLTFQRTTSSSQADIRIISFFENSNTLGISGGFPTNNGDPANTIRLNTRFYNNTTRRTDAATTITHEIGHAIGFRHTDFADRSFSCGLEKGIKPNEGIGANGANHIPGTPTGPSTNSWMLACNSNTNRPFTLSDQIALYVVYSLNRSGVPLLRYYNRGSGDHFYTTNYSELGNGRSGYISEGITGIILSSQIAGTSAFHRYYNPRSGDHFYTTNYSELEGGRGGYTYEGITGYIYSSNAAGRKALYRYYNPGSGDHFYTTNYSEIGVGRFGYVSEGIAGYLLSN